MEHCDTLMRLHNLHCDTWKLELVLYIFYSLLFVCFSGNTRGSSFSYNDMDLAQMK
jgi:hypothetical protein